MKRHQKESMGESRKEFLEIIEAIPGGIKEEAQSNNQMNPGIKS